MKNQNVTIANNATAIIKKDGIIIKGEKIEYFKDKSFLLIKNGKISTTTENLKIQSKIIEYEIDRSNLYLKGDVEVIDDINNLVMNCMKNNNNRFPRDKVNHIMITNFTSKIRM